MKEEDILICSNMRRWIDITKLMNALIELYIMPTSKCIHYMEGLCEEERQFLKQVQMSKYKLLLKLLYSKVLMLASQARYHGTIYIIRTSFSI